jgi:hypothetical protein
MSAAAAATLLPGTWQSGGGGSNFALGLERRPSPSSGLLLLDDMAGGLCTDG